MPFLVCLEIFMFTSMWKRPQCHKLTLCSVCCAKSVLLKKGEKNIALWKTMQIFIFKQMVSKWGRLKSENRQENEIKCYCNTGGVMKSAELKSESIIKRQQRATPFYAVHSHKLARHSTCRPAGSPKKFCSCNSAGFQS